MDLWPEEDLLLLASVLEKEEKEKDQKKRKWVHEAWAQRETEGEFITLYKELQKDESKFIEYFRMSENTFNLLFNKLESCLEKKDTNWRKSISAKERLAVCLRYLATGDSLKTISFSYRLGHSTVYEIVKSTCKIIVENLLPEVMPTPNDAMWRAIAKDFEEVWNFPNCIGAIDGKHVHIQAPPNSGSLYFNYKKTYSIVLLAVVDASYNFIAVDVGAFGKNSDGGIFAKSNFGKMIEGGRLQVPTSQCLPKTNIEIPFVLVGDEAFPLKPFLMRPYPGQSLDNSKRIFNYRLSRARRTVENAFGILTQKFRIFQRKIQASPEFVDHIVLSTVALHNFIKKYDRNTNNYEVSLETTANESLQDIPQQGGNASKDSFAVREQLREYFVSEQGSVPWQNLNI